MGIYKGIPSDIDLIFINREGEPDFVEIKEKDRSKTHPFGFGIDIQRMADALYIIEKTGKLYHYFVRHVDNQTERNFIEWKWIEFKKFAQKVDVNLIKTGGTGMNTAGDGFNPTLVVSENEFHEFA